MLNIWYGMNYPKPNVMCPDIVFEEVYEDWMLETEFTQNVMYNCSGEVTLVQGGVLRKPNGQLISPDKLSSGAKTLILMMYTNLVCDFGWCGENCEPFLEYIADTKENLIVTCTRYYNPLVRGNLASVRILNNEKVYTNMADVLLDVSSNGWV